MPHISFSAVSTWRFLSVLAVIRALDSHTLLCGPMSLHVQASLHAPTRLMMNTICLLQGNVSKYNTQEDKRGVPSDCAQILPRGIP